MRSKVMQMLEMTFQIAFTNIFQNVEAIWGSQGKIIAVQPLIMHEPHLPISVHVVCALSS